MNFIYLNTHSSNTFAPGAQTILFSPIKVEHFCEHSDMLDSESAAEHFKIMIRHDVWVTKQLTMGRSWQVHFFVGDAPLLAIIFSSQKCFNVLIEELYELLQANLLLIIFI